MFLACYRLNNLIFFPAVSSLDNRCPLPEDAGGQAGNIEGFGLKGALKIILFHLPTMSRNTFHQIRQLRASSSLALKMQCATLVLTC